MRKRIITSVGFIAFAALVLLFAACHSTPAPPATASPSPPTPPLAPPTIPTFQRGITPRAAPPLPAIPLVEGPLAPHLVYPSANSTIPVRDSNFIFGSVGNGHATLTINGANVRVAPNGTFLAFLPVPPPTAPRYDLVARVGTDSARLSVPVNVPRARPDLSLTGRLVVDSSSASPRGVTLALRDSEPVRVSIRAPTNASAWVTAGGATMPLVDVEGNTFATDVPASALRNGGTLYVERDRDTVRFALSHVASPPRRTTLVSLGDASAQRDTDAYVIGRSTPAGTYKWMFVPGTIVEETGRSGDNVRVRLDSRLEVWVDS